MGRFAVVTYLEGEARPFWVYHSLYKGACYPTQCYNALEAQIYAYGLREGFNAVDKGTFVILWTPDAEMLRDKEYAERYPELK